MRRSERLPAVCRGIFVEYVRFETGRQGIQTQYVEQQPERMLSFRGLRRSAFGGLVYPALVYVRNL